MTYWKTKKMLMPMTRSEKTKEKTLDSVPLVNECMIFGLEEKAIVGIRAKGSWSDIRQLSKSFIPENKVLKLMGILYSKNGNMTVQARTEVVNTTFSC